MTVDIVHPSAALDAYRLVVVPTLYLVTDEDAARVTAAAHAGAQVLVTFFSGIADEDDHVRLGGAAGRSATSSASRWRSSSHSRPTRARPSRTVARQRSGPRTSRPRRRQCWTGMRRVPSRGGRRSPAGTLGTGARGTSPLPDDASLDTSLGDLMVAAGVSPVVDGLPAGVEAVRRRSPDESWLFLANDTSETHELAVVGYDLVAERDVDGVRLGPGEVAVIRER